MSKPATRAELLEVAGLVQLSLLSQTLFGTSLIGKDEKLQRDMGEKTIDQASQINQAMRRMIARWEAEA